MNLVSCVRETALEQPNKTAFHFMGSDTSYADFDQSIARFASALRE